MATASKSRYLPHSPFHADLQRRVDAWFAEHGQATTATPGMVLKTAVIGAWFVGSYLLLLLWASTPLQVVPLAMSLGLSMAGIGFNIQHDGGHHGYSKSRTVNRLMAAWLDLVGGSSYVWRWKHSVFHHSNPNVDGLDSDIDLRPFCRIAPSQPRHPAHRLQFLYVWFLYGALAVKWQFYDDFRDLLAGRIAGQKFPRPRGFELFLFVAGKLAFVSWAFVIPALLHPLWAVAAVYGIASVTVSLALALTFQLAHAVEGAAFAEERQPQGPSMDWAAHQVATCVDFAPKSPFWTWYMGGLNYQIEHHLFPRLCHVHLPEVAKIVEETCREHGVPYRVHPSVSAALWSHARWLFRMGQPDPVLGKAEVAG